MSSRNELKDKWARRKRRKRHVRRKVYGSAEKPRLTVHRSHQHISCQIVDDFKGVTLAAVSSLQKAVGEEIGGFAGNCRGAAVVGRLIAERAKELGIERAQFDRNGYQFHGRVKALAEAAREAGLKL